MKTKICLALFILSQTSWVLLRAQTIVFNFANFDEVANVSLQGDANFYPARLRLTPASAEKVGGAWFNTKRFIRDGFETTFQFQMAGGTGGEGFAFVLQNNALPGLGPSGAGLGYSGIPNSLAVEFDTLSSPSLIDHPAPHVSVQTRGTLANSADQGASLSSASFPALADGSVHTARLVYAPGTLQVFVDDLSTPRLSVALDIATTLNLDKGQAWFGFTAATGAGGQNQDLLSWSFTTSGTPLSATISEPLEGASYVAPATISLTASATNDGVNVAVIEFFAGTRKIGQATNAPFAFVWDSVVPGTYLLTAQAIDVAGRTNISPPVRIVVHPAQPSIGITLATGANGNRYPMDPNDLAGLIPQRNWNNLYTPLGGAGQLPNARDALGDVTPLDVTVNFYGPNEDPSINENLMPDVELLHSFDRKLMKAHLFDLGTNGAPIRTNSTINVSQIPFLPCDILIYSEAPTSGADRVGQFRLGSGAGATSIYLRDAAWSPFAGLYAQANGTNDAGAATVAGNYVRFNGINSNSVSITVMGRSATDGFSYAAVSAIQIVPSVLDVSIPPSLVRGPYLQTATQTGITVRWRTSRPVASYLAFGRSATALTNLLQDDTPTAEHAVVLTNLLSNTRYFYSIGASNLTFAGGTNFFFTTHPNTAKPTRIWAIGDAGTANSFQAAVRDAFTVYSGSRLPDVWLMLGDNAYNSGTDGEYQNAVFNMYTNLIPKVAIWPTIGNHETAQSHTPVASTPYLQIFNLPRNGEAGGVSSGTERYYSFNYGNIHFVCLDAMTSERTPDGVQANWLREDLAANTNFWLIAFWHHPPYTKGSHDSDNLDGADIELVEMRENIVPILESYGVDLVLGGHSHCYERSYLLHGHYGYSTDITEDNFVDHNSGYPEDGGYTKHAAGLTPYVGTVYVVAGSSGQATFDTGLNHPAMQVGLLRLGSLVVDIDGNTLTGRFLRESGDVEDQFVITKESPPPPFRILSSTINGNSLVLEWQATPGARYSVQRRANLAVRDWQQVGGPLTAASNRLSWSHPVGAAAGFYRIVRTDN